MLTAHSRRSRERLRQHPVVLCQRDTTELVGLPRRGHRGLGPLSYKAQRGLNLHPT